MEFTPEDLVEFGGATVDFGAQLGRRLIHQVNGFVGQKPIGDIAIGKDSGGDQSRVFDADTVMLFIAILEPPQYRDGVLHAGLVHDHRLESPLQGGVFFDMFAILIERGRPDTVQFSPSQQRLKQVPRIHGAIGFARTHHGVQFVYEEDDLPLGRLHFF